MTHGVANWFQHGMPPTEQPALSSPPLEAGCSVVVCTKGRPASVARLLDSLVGQEPRPDRLVVVDASTDTETQRIVTRRRDLDALAGGILYFRVRDPLRGLTRQRNFALGWVATDLVAFFDDDIVLLPGCLRELERVHRAFGDEVVGVAARLENQSMKPTALARASRALGMVSTLRPGSYCRSGITVPWEFLSDSAPFVEGEWLYATATMWKTAAARATRFFDGFSGYSLGEDLEFSLRAARFGKIGVATRASVLHLHDPDSRPDPFTLGFMEIFNRFVIQARGLPNRSRADVAWFAYAWTLDTLLLTRDLRVKGRRRDTLNRIRGRLKGAYHACRGGHAPASAS